MYKVVKFFRDLQDNNHAYHVGEQFPHNGMKVSNDRLVELSTEANRRHEPLIEWVEDEPVEVEPVVNRAEVAQQEPVEGFMNPPEVEEPEATPEEPEKPKESAPKPKKKRGRPRNDAE